MSNIQVTHDSDVNNARSESAIVVNPNNPLQIVSASKKFKNIQPTISRWQLLIAMTGDTLGTTPRISYCHPAQR